MVNLDTELTVVLSAWNRTQFLSNALESVRRQSVPRTQFEVIINTNLGEDQLRAAGVTSDHTILPNRRPEQGRFYAYAIRAARGSIVTFLDDDDTWETSRLERVLSQFRGSAELGFYHNAQRRIGVDSLENVDVSRTTAIAWRPLSGELRLRPPITRDQVELLLRSGGGFNLSSMAVRRSTILPRLEYLEQMTTSDDSFMLYSSLLSGSEILAEPQQLTNYRVHNSNLSRQLGSGTPTVEPWAARALTSNAVLQNMIVASGRADLLPCLQREMAILEILRDLRMPLRRRSEVAVDLFHLLERLSSVNTLLNLGVAGAGFARLLSSRAGAILHSHFHT
jgi:hypothetical protein